MYQRRGDQFVCKGKAIATVRNGGLVFASPYYRRAHAAALQAMIDSGELSLDDAEKENAVMKPAEEEEVEGADRDCPLLGLPGAIMSGPAVAGSNTGGLVQQTHAMESSIAAPAPLLGGMPPALASNRINDRMEEPAGEADLPKRPLTHKHFGQYTADWLVYDALTQPQGAVLEKWGGMARRNEATFGKLVDQIRKTTFAERVLQILNDYKLINF